MSSRILGLSLLGSLSLSVLGMVPAALQEPAAPPPVKGGQPASEKRGSPAEKKEAEGGPEADLQSAYSLLRRLRSDGAATGRTDPRIRDWIERATKYYCEGVRALREENSQLARHYAAVAHDLARAIDHTRNAPLYDHPDENLPPPPGKAGPGREAFAQRELTHAYERIHNGDDGSDAGPEAKYFRDAASKLYNDARRDFEAGRTERAGELARGVEAMMHVCEHLGHAADLRIAPPPDTQDKSGRGSKRPGAAGDRGTIKAAPDRP